MFSPIFAINSVNTSSTFFPSISNAFNSSSLVTSCFNDNSTNFSPNDLNSSFLATKSVSELNSNIAPFFLSDVTAPNTNPSAATLPDFLAAFAIPFSLNQSIDFSISPAFSSNAFLQSSIPAPVLSLNSFINPVVTAIISS